MHPALFIVNINHSHSIYNIVSNVFVLHFSHQVNIVYIISLPFHLNINLFMNWDMSICKKALNSNKMMTRMIIIHFLPDKRWKRSKKNNIWQLIIQQKMQHLLNRTGPSIWSYLSTSNDNVSRGLIHARASLKFWYREHFIGRYFEEKRVVLRNQKRYEFNLFFKEDVIPFSFLYTKCLEVTLSCFVSISRWMRFWFWIVRAPGVEMLPKMSKYRLNWPF
jgi:hypothetical protein